MYQEAKRRGMTVPAATLQKAQTEFRAQFPNEGKPFDGFLKTEMQGFEAGVAAANRAAHCWWTYS